MGFKFHFYFLPLVGGKIMVPPNVHLQPLESGDMVPYPTEGEYSGLREWVEYNHEALYRGKREAGKWASEQLRL